MNQVFLDVASMGCCAPINEISMSLVIKKKKKSLKNVRMNSELWEQKFKVFRLKEIEFSGLIVIK